MRTVILLSKLFHEEMLSNASYAASTETVPMCWWEKSEASEDIVGQKSTGHTRVDVWPTDHCQPVGHTTSATNNDAAANSLALELYCYWEPEAPCIGYSDASTKNQIHQIREKISEWSDKSGSSWREWRRHLQIANAASFLVHVRVARETPYACSSRTAVKEHLWQGRWWCINV